MDAMTNSELWEHTNRLRREAEILRAGTKESEEQIAKIKACNEAYDRASNKLDMKEFVYDSIISSIAIMGIVISLITLFFAWQGIVPFTAEIILTPTIIAGMSSIVLRMVLNFYLIKKNEKIGNLLYTKN